MIFYQFSIPNKMIHMYHHALFPCAHAHKLLKLQNTHSLPALTAPMQLPAIITAPVQHVQELITIPCNCHPVINVPLDDARRDGMVYLLSRTRARCQGVTPGWEMNPNIATTTVAGWFAGDRVSK